MMERNYTIDFLRFFASSWVVLFHLNETTTYLNNSYRNFVKLGALGVPIFFVVSGYCIALAGQNSKGTIDFMVRRFFRIFPAYWFSLIVVMFIVAFHIFFFGQNSVASLPKSISDVLATLFLLTSPFSSVPTINWVYWSLTVEIFFYLVVGLSLFFHHRLRYVMLLAVSLAAFIPNIDQAKGLFFLRDWASFGLGLSLFVLQTDSKRFLYPLLLLVINCLSLYNKHHFDPYFITSVAALILIAVSIFWRDVPDNPVSRLGDYAYSLYLLHIPVGVYLICYLKSTKIQMNIFYNIAFDLGVLGIMFIFSAVSFTFLEKRGIRMGRKIANKLGDKPKALKAVPA